ncbi:MAG TPA: MFS transporter [Candidatus Binataceae bacterium]|nr:MFS transporter [Candidatus Binataceae bacterium]
MTNDSDPGSAASPPASGTAARGAIFGLFPPLNPREWRVFGIAATAGFFDNYDTALLSLALTQIQRGLGMAEAHLGEMLSIVRLGYLLSLAIAPLADALGRRRLLLFTIFGYTFFTGLSAIAPGEKSFIAAQCMARAFAGTEEVVALVIVAEEVRAGVRGWMIGMLGALIASGYGLAAIAFAFIHTVPYGWRGLYALALVPLLIIAPLRRLLPESHRFEHERLQKGALRSRLIEPLADLIRLSPGRLAMLLGASFLIAMGSNPASYLYAKYLQDAHRWSPGQVSSLVFFGGAIGIIGNIFSGRLSDRFGRRTMGALFTLLGPLFTVWMFTARNNSVIAAWVLRLFFDTASATIVSAYAAELFPTSYRASAGSAMLVASTLGGALGLTLEALLYGVTGSHWSAISYLNGFSMLAPIIIYRFFPETAGRELEAISQQNISAI